MAEQFPPESPFAGMAISSHTPLRRIARRGVCQGCHKSMRYFCYRCVRLGAGLSIPSVVLPMQMHIIKHARELEGKSTAVHAKLLAPAQVTLATYDSADERALLELAELPGDTSVLLFPDETARPVAEIDWTRITRLVVIDGTWQQAKAMVHSAHLSHLVHRVKLDASNQTLFWRYQSIGPHCLSTIEAIYRLSQEFELHQIGEVRPDLDNLLYFFSFFYHLIQHDYQSNPTRKFTTKHTAGYVKRS